MTSKVCSGDALDGHQFQCYATLPGRHSTYIRFIGKFYIVAAGVKGSTWLLVLMLIINSAIGLFYYIRIIAVMCEKQNEKEQSTGALRPSTYLISGFSVAAYDCLAMDWGFPRRAYGIDPVIIESINSNLIPI